MRNKTIAILENRVGEQIAAMIRKRGGIPFLAPAMTEVPDIEIARVDSLLHAWQLHPPGYFIFQTGVGVKALHTAVGTLGKTDAYLRMLKAGRVIARGPKSTAALRALDVRIDASAQEPYTTSELLDALRAFDLRGSSVVVQRYGETNGELLRELATRGAQVTELAVYRWGIPRDTEPLSRLLAAFDRNEIDAIAFTSAAQAVNLFAFAGDASGQEALHRSLARTLVASIGPICSRALRGLGIRVDLESHPPKLMPFVNAIGERLSESTT